MRHPGIEPGAPRWQRGILPLNQWRFRCKNKNGVRSGIRTHAPEETGALNQRLRPLGHPNTAYVKSGSPGMDSNHRPRDRCCGYTIYSPPLYQLSYRELTLLVELVELRGISSIGRVRRSQRRGTGIETRILHIFAACCPPRLISKRIAPLV